MFQVFSGWVRPWYLRPDGDWSGTLNHYSKLLATIRAIGHLRSHKYVRIVLYES
jgi:hypothetical protein